MNAFVYTVERSKDLHDFAQKLREMHLRPKFQSFGDGFLGLPTFAPFDKILVTWVQKFFHRTVGNNSK